MTNRSIVWSPCISALSFHRFLIKYRYSGLDVLNLDRRIMNNYCGLMQNIISKLLIAIVLSTGIFTFPGVGVLEAQVWVNDYHRSDGTYVRGHYRSSPDGNPRTNWSYPGNVNPYTGERATGDTSTYLRNYYGNNSHTRSAPSRSFNSFRSMRSGSTYSAPSPRPSSFNSYRSNSYRSPGTNSRSNSIFSQPSTNQGFSF